MTKAEPSASDTASVPRYLAELERALARLLGVARALEAAPASAADVRPAAQRLQSTFGHVFDAYDQRSDPLRATRAAIQSIDESLAELPALAADDPPLADLAAPLEEARTALQIAEERYGRVPPELAPPRDLTASGDVPGFHQVVRASLTPVLSVASPLPAPEPASEEAPPPKTFEEMERRFEGLRERAAERRAAAEAIAKDRKEERDARSARTEPALPPPGYTPGHHCAITREELARRRTRDCFEEVAMLGMQRAPLLGDPWRSAAVLEKRMLAAVDAIAALGPTAIAHLEPLVMDSPAKDPSRGFALAMVAGCLEGRDALGAAERVFRVLGPGAVEVRHAVGGALKLVPHPGLGALLRQWLDDADDGVRATAIEVLAYREDATADELTRAAKDPSSIVRAAALPGAGVLRVAELPQLLAGAREDGDGRVLTAAWEAMALSGDPAAADAPVEHLSGEHAAEAALAVAIAGQQRHAETLLERLRETSERHLAIALGWAGLIEGVPALIGLLEKGDDELALSSAFALNRITGAELFDDVDLPVEKVDVQDVDVPDVPVDQAPPPLAQVVSDPRDLPSDGSPDRMRLPTVRPEVWKAWWAKHGSQMDGALRHRRGRPYSPLVSLLELDDYLLTPPERSLLQRELVVRSGRWVRLDPHDFVPVQEAALRAWNEAIGSASFAGGSWSRAARR